MEKYTYIRKTITWDSRRYEVRGKTEQEACEKLADLVVSLKRGEFAASGQTTVEQWFQQWMQTYKIPSGITPKSLRLYDEKYNGYIGPAIGQKKLQDVRDLHLQTILNTQAGRSYSHVSKLRMVLQELFRQARRSRLIVFDPAEGLQLPESTKRSHRPITAAERRHILALAKEHRAGLWVLTILYAGLRPGETAALSWKDIDFDRNEIHVYKAIESGTKTVKAPKTPAGVRDIPMRQELRDRLLDAQGRPDDLVFPAPAGGERQQPPAPLGQLCPRLRPAHGRESPGRRHHQARPGPRPDPLLPAPHLLHRSPAGGRAHQRGQRTHGPREHLRHRQHLHPPRPKSPPQQHGQIKPQRPQALHQAPPQGAVSRQPVDNLWEMWITHISVEKS